jgi:UDP-hydrolysing UDP-N-acetyl-D-glucosamine 2-epimerase
MYTLVEGDNPETMVKSVALAMSELSSIFARINPDIVLTVADRYETLATAIAAAYMNIPLAHTQGGEVTGTIDESVRHAVTKLAHIHFPASLASKNRIIKMGEHKENVYFTGGPEMDILESTDLKIKKNSSVHNSGIGYPIDFSQPYILMVQHPVTTEYSCGLHQMQAIINALFVLNIQVAVLWPNIDAGTDLVSKGLRLFHNKNPQAKFHYYKNFSPEDYARILNNAVCLVGNSSSFIREGAYLGIPAVIVGSRQMGREHGKNIINVDYDTAKIKKAVMKQIKHGRYPSEKIFGDGKAGKRIAKILATCKTKVQKKLAY